MKVSFYFLMRNRVDMRRKIELPLMGELLKEIEDLEKVLWYIKHEIMVLILEKEKNGVF